MEGSGTEEQSPVSLVRSEFDDIWDRVDEIGESDWNAIRESNVRLTVAKLSASLSGFSTRQQAGEPVNSMRKRKSEEVKAADEGEVVFAFEDPVNFTVKHPLQHKWTLWYDSQQKKATQTNWHDNLKKLITIETVEDFWGVYNNVIKASQLVPGSNFHFFKQGVQPMWEDPFNAKGGKWVLQVTKARKKDLDSLWLSTVLACVGEHFEDSDEICGAVVSVRRHADRISLWTKSTTSDNCNRIGYDLRLSVAEFVENPGRNRSV
ncbi:hypothetical protein HDU96_005176 [Phlyctochytrium bullatum]|nr:hypothetical protein HDU96_005176 [Phlyctochytrium bullatum]